MVTAPLFIVLAIAAFVAVKYGSTKPGGMILGVLLGLSLASTSLGPPMLAALNDAMTSVIDSMSGVARAH
jgi:hypothetical protein